MNNYFSLVSSKKTQNKTFFGLQPEDCEAFVLFVVISDDNRKVLTIGRSKEAIRHMLSEKL